MTNMLLCFPRRVRFSRSTGTASLMTWYIRRMMIRITYLTWLLIMGVTWLFSYTRVKRQRNFYSRMLLYLNPYPRTMLISRLSKQSSSANYRVEIWISGTKLSIRVWDFLRRTLREFTICTPWRIQALTNKNEKWLGRKRCALNNTSPLDPSSYFYFPPPWSSHQSLQPSLCQKSPPWSLSCPYLPPSSSL